jgi:hypothetical protein
LQLGDIVSPLHGPTQVEQPIAELVAGFDDRCPRLVVADAVSFEPASDLERSDRGLSGCAEPAVLGLARIEAGSREPALEIACWFAACADA